MEGERGRGGDKGMGKDQIGITFSASRVKMRVDTGRSECGCESECLCEGEGGCEGECECECEGECEGEC